MVVVWGTDTGGTSLAACEETALTLLSAAEVIDVVSTDNTNDKAAGSGALVVTLVGLDANYLLISEDVTMTGTTDATTTQAFLRINHMFVKTGAAAAGDITAEDSGDNVLAKIFTGTTTSNGCRYTVPAGKTAVITSWGVDGAKSAATVGVRGYLEANYAPGGKTGVWTQLDACADGYNNLATSDTLYVGEKKDIRLRHQTTSGTSTVTGRIAISLK